LRLRIRQKLELLGKLLVWISQEGGLFEDRGRLSNRAWIAVCDKDVCITAEAST